MFFNNLFELLQRPHNHVPCPDCLQSLLVGFLTLGLAVPAVLQFDGEERALAPRHEQHEVGKPGAHAHGLELGRLGGVAEAAVGRVVQVEAQLRVGMVEPRHARFLQRVLVVVLRTVSAWRGVESFEVVVVHRSFS